MAENETISFPGPAGTISVPKGVLELDFVEGQAKIGSADITYTGVTKVPLKRFGLRRDARPDRRGYEDDDDEGQIYGTSAYIEANRDCSVAVNHSGADRQSIGAGYPLYVSYGAIKKLFIYLEETTTLRVECYANLVVQKGIGSSGASPVSFAPGNDPTTVIWTISLVRSELTFLNAFSGTVAAGAAGNVSLACLRSYLTIHMITVVQRTGAAVDFHLEIWESELASRTEPPIVTEQYARIYNRAVLPAQTDELLYVELMSPPLEYFDREAGNEIHLRLDNQAGGTTSEFDIVMKIGALLQV